MSRIARIKNTYINEAGLPEIHFTDDLGIDYTLAYSLDWILNYFAGHPMGGLSQVAQGNLEDFLKYGGQIDPYFARYVNADFMMWKAVIELEYAN
jgi:hypothetical protein